MVSDRDAGILLQYLQGRMRSAGLDALNDRVLTSIRVDPGPASVQLVRYLDALESELELRADSRVRSTVDRYRSVASTADGEVISGIQIILTPEDRDLFGVDSVELGGDADYDGVAAAIRDLRDDLAELH